ncbi:MAG: hypothetical protein ACO2ON_03980 [Candidatus Nanopusillus sp.]
MGKIVTELTKNLIIFRPDEEEIDPDDDYLFYIYDQYLDKVTEYISEEKLEEMGKELLTMKELYTNVVRKAASMVTPIVRKKEESTVLGYRLFGFLLLMKLSIDMLLSYIYAKGLVELTDSVVDSEGLVAYKLGQYFLNELNYKAGFNKIAVDILSNEQLFIEFYNILITKLKEEKDIEKVYYSFTNAIKKVKLNL